MWLLLLLASAAALSPSDCKGGEDWDAELSMCAPRFHAPLAFESAIMDGRHAACNASFYQMMCGAWIRDHTNENRAFSYAHRKIAAQLRRIVTPAGGEMSAPQRFYSSCVQRGSAASTLESRLVFKHLRGRFVEPVRAHADLPAVFGKMARAGYTTPLLLSIERHPTTPAVLPLLTYDNLPEEALTEQSVYDVLYTARPVTSYGTLEEQHVITGALKVGRGLRNMRRFKLEEVESMRAYIPQLASHLREWREVESLWGRNWDLMLQELGGPQLRFAANQTIWVPDMQYVADLIERGLRRYTVPEWRAYLEYVTLYHTHQTEPDLPDNVYFRRHDHEGPLGKGHRRAPRIKRRTEGADECARITVHMLPGLVAAQYLERHHADRAEDRKAVMHLVQSLRSALRNRVRHLQWLSAEDRRVLEHKLNRTLVRVAEPDLWAPEPFAGSVSADRYDHNLNLVRAYRVQRNLELWRAAPEGTPAWDRNAIATFASPIMAVNAYYSGPSNSVTILAGLMQHPFYNKRYGAVSKYAIMGSVVGHEMSHMLDHHGLYWDAQGSFRADGILSAEGMRRFYERTRCVISEFGPAPQGCPSDVPYGNHTLGEDLADLTGVSIAYEAMESDLTTQLSLGDRQHFFMVQAQAFCESYDREHLCEAVLHDVHAAPAMRVDRTDRNLRAFAQAFHCHEGHAMWRNETCSVY